MFGSGMTLRQWYAGQALAGLLANHNSMVDSAAKKCFEFADAMIAHGNKNDG